MSLHSGKAVRLGFLGSVCLVLAIVMVIWSPSIRYRLMVFRYDRAITLLLSSSQNSEPVYVEDASCSSSVTWMMVDEHGPYCLAEVIPIVEIGRPVVPLLIEMLDDTRATPLIFLGGPEPRSKVKVPLGYVGLDILVHIIEPVEPMFRPSGGDDGMGYGWNLNVEDFYFRPDIYYKASGAEEVKRVKSNWTNAYKQGWVRFDEDWALIEVPIPHVARPYQYKEVYHEGGIDLPQK